MSARAAKPLAPQVAKRLEALFSQYHRPELISPDPLECVLRYDSIADREVVALIAATVAFGRVPHILRSIDLLLPKLGAHPSAWLLKHPPAEITKACSGWRHRWATGEEMANLLCAARSVIREHGSLGAAWTDSLRQDDADALDTLIRWVGLLDQHGLEADNSLLPRPERKSASKRLHLYLRWMIRKDAVDPGGWNDSPSRLLFPLDVHMHRIATALGATRRRAADLATTREITAWFRRIAPTDPVRFDFALTRLPIHDGLTTPEIHATLLRAE